MTAKNEHTDKLIYSCPMSKAYKDNFDKIFKKPKKEEKKDDPKR